VATVVAIIGDGSQPSSPNKLAHRDDSARIAKPIIAMEVLGFEGDCGRCQIGQIQLFFQEHTLLKLEAWA
jgi:hypothetical protein